MSSKSSGNPLDSFLDLPTRQKVWRLLRPVAILLIGLLIVYFVVSTAFHWLLNTFYSPIDPNDPSPVTVTIRSGSSTSTIAEVLYDTQDDGEPGENQLIKNKAVFKVYVDFTGVGSKLQSGTYTFDRTMSIPEIVDQLTIGDGHVTQILRFTLTEGMTAADMAESLVEQGVLSSTSRFLELCRTMAGVTTNELIDLPEDSAEVRLYQLEGYLFPDTYEVYEGSSEETVISRLTTRFYGIFSEEYILRAEELGMSIDEVVTLASIIEKEAKTDDFAKVSAVFHNRLEEGMPLQSDATISYMLQSDKLVFTAEDLATESPYNTYLNAGLPAGPICNPGRAAIEAALYPDEEMLDGGYLYFCLADPETGALVFARTLEEHQKNVETYSPLWETGGEDAE